MATELTIAAAASLVDALEDMRAELLSDPDLGIDEKTVYQGSSGYLVTQILNGNVSPDVFISAAPYPMQDLVDANKIAGTVTNLLGNKLVLIKNDKEFPVPINSLDDVNQYNTIGQGVEVVIADPAGNYNVPAGRYTRTLLIELGVWGEISPYATMAGVFNVREALRLVASAAGPAIGFVYYTDALSSSTVEIVDYAPDNINESIIYPVAPVVGGNITLANTFINFIKGNGFHYFTDRGFTSLL